MNKQAPTLGRLLVIVGFALSCFGLLMFLWLSFGGPVPLQPQQYRFQAAFTDATTLAKQADVRVAGVTVGKVEALELDPEGNRMLATLTIDDEYAPLRSDARAILRQKTLLGETYVELTLGSAGAPVIPENGRLANTQVAPTVDFDELLRIFDPETRKTFQSWQETSAQATMGRAQDINDSLGNLPVFIESGQSVVDVLNDRRGALQSLVRETGTTFGALTENEQALRSFIADNARVFEVLGARRDSLAQSFQILPTFLAETRSLFDRLRVFSTDTDPLIRDLEPVLDDLQPTLVSLETLSPDLERLFEDIDPLVEAADVGFPPLAAVLRELDPTLRSTGPFLQQLNPILEFLELYQPTVSDFISVGAGALGNTPPEGRGAGEFTNGHALPQVIMLGDQTLPSMTRTPTNRGNAYLPPSAKTYDTYKAGDPPNFILPNWDCANAGGEMPAGEDPGCDVMEPFGFQGEQQRYPGLAPSAPGGRSLQEGER
ncbi:MAG: MCE family protein [Actinomycetota bacterium]|nr:MCE family protein [Actinomycetota bacterium]